MAPLIAIGVLSAALLAFRVWEQRQKTTKKIAGKMSGLAIKKMYSTGITSPTVSKEEIDSVIEQLKQDGKLLKSPFTGVNDQQWCKFVECLVCEAPRSGRLGMFSFSPVRVKELTGGDFQDNPQWEYNLFIKSMADYGPKILEAHNENFGQDGFAIDAVPISLSGLLAVAHCAGMDGMESWLTSERDRKKFKATTAAFHCANGIF